MIRLICIIALTAFASIPIIAKEVKEQTHSILCKNNQISVYFLVKHEKTCPKGYAVSKESVVVPKFKGDARKSLGSIQNPYIINMPNRNWSDFVIIEGNKVIIKGCPCRGGIYNPPIGKNIPCPSPPDPCKN